MVRPATIRREVETGGKGCEHQFSNSCGKFSASMTAVAMSAATAATAATAAGFFARGSIVASTGGSEGGKFLVELRGTAMRAFRAMPFGGTDEDFGIAFALCAMKFLDRHCAKIIGTAEMIKRRC